MTAATCWLETANTDPSRCWVGHPDDGCGHEIDASSLHDLQIASFIFSKTLSIAAICVQVLMCHPQLIWSVAKELE